MKNARINRGVIKKIALALGELNDEVVFVGGAVVGLYINDPAAEDVRPTKDVDISLSIKTTMQLENIREKLTSKGFFQTAEENVICRFRYDDVKIDVMNTNEIGWAPANRWFDKGFDLKQSVEVEGSIIQILPFQYYLATKFEAYNNRGNNEPRTSHDFEDIVYILDNRVDLVKMLLNAEGDVKSFLKNEFMKILNEAVKQEAILGNLFHETRDERFNTILKKIHAFVD